jgi:membrane protease YdiL (CAAX protease family)
MLTTQVVASGLFFLALVRLLPPRLALVPAPRVQMGVGALIGIALTMVVFAGGFAIWGTAPTAFFPGRPYDPALTWQWGIWKAAVFAPAVLVIVWRAIGRGWASILDVGGTWRWVGPGAQALLPVIGFSLLPWTILNGGFLIGPARLSVTAPIVLVAIATSVWSAALPEELFFRLVLQSRLEARIAPAAAVVVSGILFGAIHLPEFIWMSHLGLADAIAQVAAYEILPGLLYGFMWYRYRNICGNVVAHAAFDSAFLIALLTGALR